MITESSPYKIVKQAGDSGLCSQIVYTGELINLERQKGQQCVFDNQAMINRLFWTGDESEDRLEVMIDSQYWEFFSKNAYLGLFYEG